MPHFGGQKVEVAGSLAIPGVGTGRAWRSARAGRVLSGLDFTRKRERERSPKMPDVRGGVDLCALKHCGETPTKALKKAPTDPSLYRFPCGGLSPALSQGGVKRADQICQIYSVVLIGNGLVERSLFARVSLRSPPADKWRTTDPCARGWAVRRGGGDFPSLLIPPKKKKIAFKPTQRLTTNDNEPCAQGEASCPRGVCLPRLHSLLFP